GHGDPPDDLVPSARETVGERALPAGRLLGGDPLGIRLEVLKTCSRRRANRQDAKTKSSLGVLASWRLISGPVEARSPSPSLPRQVQQLPVPRGGSQLQVAQHLLADEGADAEDRRGRVADRRLALEPVLDPLDVLAGKEGRERVQVHLVEVADAREPLALARRHPPRRAVEEPAEEERGAAALLAQLLDEQREQEGEALRDLVELLAPRLGDAGPVEQVEGRLSAEGGEADLVDEVAAAMLAPRRVHGLEVVAAEEDEGGGERRLGQTRDEGADDELLQRGGEGLEVVDPEQEPLLARDGRGGEARAGARAAEGDLQVGDEGLGGHVVEVVLDARPGGRAEGLGDGGRERGAALQG